MRDHFPSETDHHLYSLEEEVIREIKCKNLCLTTLMGDGKDVVHFVKSISYDGKQQTQQYAARISSSRSSLDTQNCI